MKDEHKIVKTEVTGGHVEITLENGVRIYVSSNPKNYIHVHFSYIDVNSKVEVGLQMANEIDIHYTPVPCR